jgi:hypothetical protein
VFVYNDVKFKIEVYILNIDTYRKEVCTFYQFLIIL